MAITSERDVAEAVWRAANDSAPTLRYPAGADAVALAARSPLFAAEACEPVDAL